MNLPKYTQGISIVKPESFLALSVFNYSKTHFKIPVSRLQDFYDDIGAVQVVAHGLPLGDKSTLESKELNNLSMVYCDETGELNGIKMYRQNDFYYVELRSSRE